VSSSAASIFTARVPGGGDRITQLLERVHLTITGLVVVGGAVLAWAVARWAGSRTIYMVAYAAVGAVAIALGIARRRMDMAAIRSDLPARMREGQTGEVELTIAANKRLSTLLVTEQLHPHLGRASRVAVASLSAGEELQHSYTISAGLRGEYEIGPTIAHWSDPFGLTTRQQVLTEPVKLIVHPAIDAVDDRILARMWEDPPMRPPVSKPWPTGFEFYGMRDYVPGDDLRRVVWSAVAKTGRMLVRESEQGITDKITVLLDTQREWHSPGSPSDTFELAVRIAASVSARHLKDGFSVTLMVNDGELITAARGERAGMLLLDHLARVQPATAGLDAIGERLLGSARRGAHIVLISPHIDTATTNRLRIALDRGGSATVAKVVWEESDPASLARAASLGCRVVQVPVRTSLKRAFDHQIGGGQR